MKRLTLGLFSAFLLAVPGGLEAQNTLPQALGAQEYLDFQNANGAVAAAWGGVMVGPYNGQLTSMPGSPAVTIYCVDFAHWAGDQQVNVSNLGGNVQGTTNGYAGLTNTRLGYNSVGDTQLRYRKAAFLASLFDSYSTAALGNVGGNQAVAASTFDVSSKKNAWSGLHAAIWTIMAPPAFTFPDDATFNVNDAVAQQMAQPWVDWANAMGSYDPASFAGMDFSEWSVLTDVNAQGQAPQGDTNGKQEYLVRTTTVTPEPETMILLLSGMLLLGVTARRRLGQLEELG